MLGRGFAPRGSGAMKGGEFGDAAGGGEAAGGRGDAKGGSDGEGESVGESGSGGETGSWPNGSHPFRWRRGRDPDPWARCVGEGTGGAGFGMIHRRWAVGGVGGGGFKRALSDLR